MFEESWNVIQSKLISAENHLQRGIEVIHPKLAPDSIVMQSAGAIVGNPQWRAECSSEISAFAVACRSVPDIIQSYFGVDSHLKKWVSGLPFDEQHRRNRFQKSFRYKRFLGLRLSRARVDTMHRQGFIEIWVRVGKTYSSFERLLDSANKRIFAGSDPALQWMQTLPSQTRQYLPSHFFLKTVGGQYRELLPECVSYLRRAQELVDRARKICEKVHNGYGLTKPPRR